MTEDKIKYTQRKDGSWKAKAEFSTFGDHIAFGDTKEEAEKKIRASMKSHAYSITKGGQAFFG